MMRTLRHFSTLVFAALFLAACTSLPKKEDGIAASPLPQAESAETVTPVEVLPTPPLPPVSKPPPRIALALGGGAARGFAHIGVIKALEAQGISPDIVVGTSAGAVVGSLYAAGYDGFKLQELALQMDEGQFSDWSLPNRGVLKGQALQDFINNAVQQRPLEKLSKLFAVVATDLHSGAMIVFRSGNTGMAVRASSAIPNLFQPVAINGHEYVDGGLTSPVPVRVARSLGADFVIAVDISTDPQNSKTDSSLDVLLQTFNIMGQSISRNELLAADIVIRPVTQQVSLTNFNDRNQAVLEGEKAVASVLPELRTRLARLRETP